MSETLRIERSAMALTPRSGRVDEGREAISSECPSSTRDSTSVLCCFDDGYAPAACVMLTSLFSNDAHLEFDVHAIADDLSEDRRRAIEALCHDHGRALHWLTIGKERYSFFGLSDHFAHAAYFRIFGPELVPSRKILYLDADLIVQTDIEPLLTLDLCGHLAAAAPDVFPAAKARSRLRLLPRHPYVNTGVLVMDAERWRSEGVAEALVEHYRAHGHRLLYADQDLINECLAGRILQIESRWNLLYGDIVTGHASPDDFDVSSFRGIFHYNTGDKPWSPDAKEPYAALYRFYAARSPLRMVRRSRPGILTRTGRRLQKELERPTWRARIDRLVKAVRSRGDDLGRRLLGTRHGAPTSSYGHPEPSFSVHMLSCHEHLEMALWSLKSFSRFAELRPRIFVHDDGSLTDEDEATLCAQVSNSTVIRRAEADRRVDAWLQRHPNCRRMRQERAFFCALKLFDPWCYAPHDVLLFLDGDVLFFKRPRELLEHADQGTACFGSDYQDAYAVSPSTLRERLGIDVLPHVNAGLMVLSRKHFDLAVAERYFEAFPSPVTNRHEQTIYALLHSLAGATRLGPNYQISRRPIHPETVSHHFVSDGSRERFWITGARILFQRRVFT